MLENVLVWPTKGFDSGVTLGSVEPHLQLADRMCARTRPRAAGVISQLTII